MSGAEHPGAAVALADWGWGPAWAAHVEDESEGRHPARVTRRERTLWTIRTGAGVHQARVPSSTLEEGPPVVGDWVLAEPGDGSGSPWLIVAILPRRSKFSRKVAGDRDEEQVVAANIDRVWVVHGLDLPPNPRRLERYLTMSWESGATPEIVLTKADLASNAEETAERIAEVAPDTAIWVVSAKAEPWARPLSDSLRPGETVALLGPSGVGKSSLVNRLAGAELFAEGEVRPGDRKGRHTTTRRELVRLSGGALLIDTPGMRELQLWDVDEGLAATFPDIDRLAADCRFRDCRHLSEPGCAVLRGVESGDVAPERLEAYRKLEAEIEHRRRRSDPRARSEARAEIKSITRSMRDHHEP